MFAVVTFTTCECCWSAMMTNSVMTKSIVSISYWSNPVFVCSLSKPPDLVSLKFRSPCHLPQTVVKPLDFKFSIGNNLLAETFLLARL